MNFILIGLLLREAVDRLRVRLYMYLVTFIFVPGLRPVDAYDCYQYGHPAEIAAEKIPPLWSTHPSHHQMCHSIFCKFKNVLNSHFVNNVFGSLPYYKQSICRVVDSLVCYHFRWSLLGVLNCGFCYPYPQ